MEWTSVETSWTCLKSMSLPPGIAGITRRDARSRKLWFEGGSGVERILSASERTELTQRFAIFRLCLPKEPTNLWRSCAKLLRKCGLLPRTKSTTKKQKQLQRFGRSSLEFPSASHVGAAFITGAPNLFRFLPLEAFPEITSNQQKSFLEAEGRRPKNSFEVAKPSSRKGGTRALINFNQSGLGPLEPAFGWGTAIPRSKP